MQDKKTFIFNHPLMQHKISLLRDVNTSYKDFRELTNEISRLMAYEVTSKFKLKEKEIITPMGPYKAKVLADKKVVLAPIMRAGLGMVDGMLSILPTARVGHIGVYRDHITIEPVEYYCKMPEDVSESEVLLLDPMLATGGSANAAIGFMKKRGVKNIKFVCIIAVEEGINKVHEENPDVDIYCGAIDERLNEEFYIVPGLGDAGDRLFGTK